MEPFHKKEYAGRIMVMDDPREILGAGLKANGFSVNSTDAGEINKAKATVEVWKKGIVKFDNDLIKSAFAKKEIWIAMNYPEKPGGRTRRGRSSEHGNVLSQGRRNAVHRRHGHHEGCEERR